MKAQPHAKPSESIRYPPVSIIILNYNGLKLGHLETVLDSVLKTDYPEFEVILVDNASSDGSVEWVKKKYPSVKVVRLNKNLYTVGGYMAGVLVARGKYVAILNNDIEVEPNWLKPLIEVMERHPYIAAADSKYRNYFQRELFDDSAAAGRWIDYFGNNYTRGVGETDHGQYDKPVYIMGVLTIFNRKILLQVGGFDPLYVFGYEDIDVGWRLYLAGYKVVYVPESVIYHKSGGSTKKGGAKRVKPEFFYLNKRNRLITLVKNYSIKHMMGSLLVALLEYFLSVVYFMLTGNNVYGLQIVRAVSYVLRNMRRIVVKRYSVQRLRKRSDKEVMKYMVPYAGDLWRILQNLFIRLK